MKKEFYVSVSGDWGDCMVSYDNEPTWDYDNAMKFECAGEAELWISHHGKEWDSGDTLTVCEFEIED